MQSVALGDPLLIVWVVGLLALCVGVTGVAVAMLRSLSRDALSRRARQTRFEVLGWSALLCAALWSAAWPGMTVFHRVTVDSQGQWSLENALGVALAVVPRGATRTVEGEDLGGLQWGSGRMRIVLADGRTFTSTRLSGPRFSRALDLLGYPAWLRHDTSGSIVVPPHRYAASGPVVLVSSR